MIILLLMNLWIIFLINRLVWWNQTLIDIVKNVSTCFPKPAMMSSNVFYTPWYQLFCCLSSSPSLCVCSPTRLWVQSWPRPGMRPRKRRMTCFTPRTSGQAETSTKPCARSARATPSSALMSLSPCEPGRRVDATMKRDSLSCQRLAFPVKPKTCCHPRNSCLFFYPGERPANGLCSFSLAKALPSSIWPITPLPAF